MADAKSADPVYNLKLRRCIENIFVNFVIPFNVLTIFHKYSSNVLVEADFQNITAVTTQQGDHIGALRLLNRLCVYKDWFDCLLKVLRDRDVKLDHVAEAMEREKSALDSRPEQDRRSPEGEIEEICQREQQLPEQRAGIRESDLARQGAGLVMRTNSRNKQLTRKRAHQKLLDQNMAQKCRRLNDEVRRLKEEKEEEQRCHEEEIKQVKEERDRAIEQEHKRLEEEAKRREQEGQQHKEYQIKQLKEEREKLEQIIQQERKHQSEEIKKLKEETRQKDQLITDLHNSIQNLKVQKKTSDATTTRALSPRNSDGVKLWNYCVTEKNPDIAVKYGLTESSLPSHLQEAEWIWYILCFRDDVEQVSEHGVTAAVGIVQTELRNILNNVNMRRRENEDDVIMKGTLQWEIIDFFRSCYSCIIGLDTHGVNSVKECLMYIKDSITENLDKLVEELGGWNDVMSQTTLIRYWKALS